MKIDVSIKSPNLYAAENKVKAKLNDVLWRSMVKMEELAKNKAPVDRGMLKNRINLQPKTPGASEYILSDGVSYGADLEYGNRPHFVPMAPLIAWVKRKGIKTDKSSQIAFAKYVQEKIKSEGVNAQPFFRPALHEVQVIWLPLIKKQVLRS